MKILAKILVVTILCLGIKSYSQDINRNDLINKLKAEKKSLFVINGIPYLYTDSLNIDKELSKIETHKISEITILKNEGKISHQRNDVIAIQYATKLSKKIIETKLQEIKLLFKDEYFGFSQHIYSDAKDPVLYFNGNKIHHTEIKKLINELKINDIWYVYSTPNRQSIEHHGQNAKNGIVIIWTNEKFNQ